MSLSLFQAEMLNDPEFAKNVKGLVGMLRVRGRLGESSRFCVFAQNSALHSGRRDAGSVAPGGLGCAPCPAENIREFKGTDCDDDMVTPSSKAGEKGKSGLLEVIKSDFSSPLAHSKSLFDSSHVSSNVGCTSLALPSASACALAACTHGFCSAPSSVVVPLCMHVGDTCACINSWSDTGRVQGPTGTKRVKGGVSGPAEDLRPVSEVEAGVNFRPAGGVRGQVAGSLPRRQPGTGTRQGQRRCGHTFPPPGGSLLPFCVTWIRIEHQAINGLDEGVWNRTVGDLGAEG